MKRVHTLFWVCVVAALAAMPARAAQDPASAASAPAAKAASAPKAAATKPAEVPKVDLNNASRAQLKTLPGIGDAEADKIIATRPYNSKADMVSKGGIPSGVYQAIRHQIYVGKPKQTKSSPDKKQNGKV